MSDIKLQEVITEEVTQPRNDGTPGSALYRVPIRLNKRPSALWGNIFVATWDRPPQYTSSHRPGIASVIGDKILLDGTTLDEIKTTHKETLKLCVEVANEKEEKEIAKSKAIETKRAEEARRFRDEVERKSKDISFE